MTSWLWWILRVLLANQNGGNILNEQWKELKGRIYNSSFCSERQYHASSFIKEQKTVHVMYRTWVVFIHHSEYCFQVGSIPIKCFSDTWAILQREKENRTYIHVTRLLAVRFSLLCMLHTTPWEGCMNHDLATEGERQLRAGKRAERTKRNFRCPICCSAIDHASCFIFARRCQLKFPFSS